MSVKLKQAFFQCVPFAIVVTFLCGLIYGIGQQALRQTADDIQVKMAEDAAALLSTGQKPESIITSQKVDIAKSLSPFLIVYDGQKKVAAASGALNGKVPPIPTGVLDSAKNGENHVTWQPEPGVREAIVVVSYTGKQTGYVLAGRSLREVEKHESSVFAMTVFVWFTCLIVLYLYFLFAAFVRETPILTHD